MKLFNRKDWDILNTIHLIVPSSGEKTTVYTYEYKGRVYKYIGDTLPTDVDRGFFIPIKTLKWNNEDVTGRMKMYAGPRHNFYASTPKLKYLFYETKGHKIVPKISFGYLSIRVSFIIYRYIEPSKGVLETINILGQSSSVMSE
jgi:hypothetical protein